MKSSPANEGCIPGLANLSTQKEIFDTVYTGVSTENPENVRPQVSYQMPEGEIRIPEFYPVLRTLDQVVPVDYYMPGCPPESHQIAAVIDLVIQVVKGEAELPPPGTVIGAGESTVCDECERQRNVKKIDKFVRIQDVEHADPELCLLEQGLPWAGAQCIGCYGPAEGVVDYGARLISAYASVIDSNDPEEIDRILDGIPDPTGQFYRFNLAGSLLRASTAAWKVHG